MGVKFQMDNGNLEIGRPPAIIEFEPEKHERPWGYFQVLYEDAHCKVKKLVIKPGQRTSLQRHLHRNEGWVCVSGFGVTDTDTDMGTGELFPGAYTYIDQEWWHRVDNLKGTEDLVIIETQTGSYFGEDDIERKEDDYGRVGKTSSSA